jgi:UDP-glucose 4-epimerase
MYILVTGGAGYIGSQTVKELAKGGFKPIVYDNLSQGRKEAVLAGELVVGDLGEREKLKQVFRRFPIEAVIHLAAVSIGSESMKQPAKYFRNNLTGSLNLLEVMLESDVKKIIFSSTAAVYGIPQQIPLREEEKTQPIHPYGASKLMFEQILASYREAYDLRYISFRYFNAAGADPEGKIGEDHSPETHLIPLILKTALGEQKEIEIFGDDYPTPDGTCIRDYIHVADLAYAHILALETLFKTSLGKIYNLGNEKGYSVREVIRVVEKVTGRRIKTKQSPRRPGDLPVLVASAEKIKKELNWQPQYPKLEEIISTAWHWLQKK